MSLKVCIDNAVSAGELTLEEGQQLKQRYDTLARKVFARGSARDQLIEEIEAEAAQRKRIALLTETVRQQLQGFVFGHVNARGFMDPMEAQMWLLDHKGQAQIESVKQHQLGLQGYIHGRVNQAMQEFRAKAKITGDLARRFGSTRKLQMDWVREMHGESTGNEYAKELAKETSAAINDTREWFNDAGGAIGKIEGYALPQHYNRERMQAVEPEEFAKDMQEHVGLERMRHPLTGNQMTLDEVWDAAIFTHENVGADGWLKREPSGQQYGKGAMFKRHADHRFFHFKDADSYIFMMEKYGDVDVLTGRWDPWSTFTGHMATMTRDIAMMRKLGPNPNAMMEFIHQSVEKHAATIRPSNKIREMQIREFKKLVRAKNQTVDSLHAKHATILKKLDKARHRTRLAAPLNRDSKKAQKQRSEVEKLQAELMESHQKLVALEQGQRLWTDADERKSAELLRQMRLEVPDDFNNPRRRAAEWKRMSERAFDELRGANKLPEEGDFAENFAHYAQGMRNWQVATKLGGAGISALSDVGLRRQAQRMAGLPHKGLITNYIKQFGPGQQKIAMQQSLILDAALHTLDRDSRHAVATSFDGVTGYIADRTLVAGGLTQMTQVNKHATGLELHAFTGMLLERNFKDLPKPYRKGMETFGLTEGDWKVMQQAGTNSAGFAQVAEMHKIDPSVAIRYNGYVHKIMRESAGEMDTRTRVQMMHDSKAGTFSGEILRNMYQFKGFGIGLLFTHFTGAYRDFHAGDNMGLAMRAVNILLIMSLMGAVSLQLKDVFWGRDPRNMNDWRFWVASVVQGGGLGIYGDFFFADHNRFGGSIGETIAGPVGGVVGDITQLTFGNIANLSNQDDTNFANEALRFAKNNTPGQNVFYLRLAWERLLFDRLHQEIDPQGFRARARRQIRNRRRDYNQEYWFAPGQTFNEADLPDLSEAIQ
ncbi:MAG: hypothetical protein AAGB04_25105 [Pseudomonadota bacterium]